LRRKVPNILYLSKMYRSEVIESFEFAFPFVVKEERDEGLLIEGVAVKVGMSRDYYLYTEEELRRSARTLIKKPLEVDHQTPRDFGHVLDAEFDDEKKEIRYLALVKDPILRKEILRGEIKPYVSIRASTRRKEKVDGVLLVGLVFEGLSLLKEREPANPQTSMRVVRDMIEKLSFQSEKRAKRLTCRHHGVIPYEEALTYRNGRYYCPQCHRQLSLRFNFRKLK